MNTNENYSESESELLSDSPDDDASEEIEKEKQNIIKQFKNRLNGITLQVLLNLTQNIWD